MFSLLGVLRSSSAGGMCSERTGSQSIQPQPHSPTPKVCKYDIISNIKKTKSTHSLLLCKLMSEYLNIKTSFYGIKIKPENVFKLRSIPCSSFIMFIRISWNLVNWPTYQVIQPYIKNSV